jgi:outer membrane protein OmpA-like peptidoglycan-associated protein
LIHAKERNLFMRILFLILLSFLYPGHKSLSQNILFEDDFTDNKNNWFTGSDHSSYNVSIHDGSYILDRYSKTSNTLFYKNINLNPKKDFTIEAVMTQLSGIHNNGYGLIWYSKADNYNVFIITSDGHYEIHCHEKEETKIRKELTPSEFINPMKTANKLSIKKTGQVTSFYVNDHYLFESDNFFYFGEDIGFELNQHMKVSIDKITVKQDKDPINLISGMPKGLIKENLGANINSQYEEKTPLIAPDGKHIYFNREGDPGNTGSPDKTDIWYASLNPDNTWSKAVNIGPPLNNNGHNAIVSITPDNNTALIMNTYYRDGTQKGAGFSITNRTINGWEIPKDVTMKNFYGNGIYETAYLSNDRKKILLTLERKDTYGGNDVYISFLTPEGSWTEPKNLGATVNTFSDELGPFLAADNITLYYSTAGKPGYGSNDIFVTKRLDDTWTNWSEPQNLGPEINTPEWDGYYVLPASGEYSYLCSNANSMGRLDLFRIKLPDSAKPNPVVLVKGRVLNAKTKEPIGAKISYEFLSTGWEAGLAQSNPATGEYKIILPYGDSYGYHAEAEGYMSINEHFDLTEKKDYIEITRDLYLVPIEVGGTFTLNNVFFIQSKAQLLSSSYSELDRLTKILQDHPGIEIKLNGHTDNQGDPKKNQILSEERVKEVKNYLVSKGVDGKRITGTGYGGSVPVASNETEETRKLNRRVEFTIVKK